MASCKKGTENKTQLPKSDFNLKTDLTDFKNKMTELDTINLWIDHSICTYSGSERIEITRHADSIKIRTEFNEEMFIENPKWEFVYEKTVPINDTVWKIEEFFKMNSERQKPEEDNRIIFQARHKGNKVRYYSNGLSDLNKFMADFFGTMKMLYPENKNNIYGVEIVEIVNLNDGEIKASELETE